jgi:NIPSNAP
VITCVVEYVIDPAKIGAFERFARRWMELVEMHGGHHHGYFLPAEGASYKALALFSFPSLAAYEQYRGLFGNDPDFVAADRIREMKAGVSCATSGRSCARFYQDPLLRRVTRLTRSRSPHRACVFPRSARASSQPWPSARGPGAPRAGETAAAVFAEGRSMAACVRGRPGRVFGPDLPDRRARRA